MVKLLRVFGLWGFIFYRGGCGFIYQVGSLVGGGCLLFPIVSSLSGGVAFFVSGVLCGFSCSDWVCDCVAKVVVDERICARGEVHKGGIVGGAQELPVLGKGPVLYFLVYWDVFHLFWGEWFVVLWGVGVGRVVFNYLSVVHLGDCLTDFINVRDAVVSSSLGRGGSGDAQFCSGVGSFP